MHSQTLQALRSEIEAAGIMQNALGHIGRKVDESRVRTWHGPGPEDITEYADDEGSVSYAAVAELRTRAGQALAERYREVHELVESGNGKAAQLRALLHSVMTAGTGVAEGADPAATLKELASEGALRLERAVDAANIARAHLDDVAPLKSKSTVKGTAKKPAKKAVAAKKPAKKSAAAKKPAKKVAAKKAPAKKTSAKKPAKKSKSVKKAR